MKLLYLLCMSALCLASQSEGNYIVDHFKNWIQTKIQNLQNDIFSAEALIKNNFESEINESVNYISENIAKAKNEIEAVSKFAPEKCVLAADNSLDDVHETASENFFECANLTDAAENLKSIGNESLVLGEELFETLRSTLIGLDKCYPFTSEADLRCVDKYVWSVFDSLEQLAGEIKSYVQDVRESSKKIAAEINDCLHPSSKNETIVYEIHQVMTILKQCSNA